MAEFSNWSSTNSELDGQIYSLQRTARGGSVQMITERRLLENCECVIPPVTAGRVESATVTTWLCAGVEVQLKTWTTGLPTYLSGPCFRCVCVCVCVWVCVCVCMCLGVCACVCVLLLLLLLLLCVCVCVCVCACVCVCVCVCVCEWCVLAHWVSLLWKNLWYTAAMTMMMMMMMMITRREDVVVGGRRAAALVPLLVTR